MARVLGALVFIVCCIIACRGPGSDLPVPAMEAFSPSVRDAILTSLSAARSASSNPEVLQDYCMVLHAHEQTDAASVCYEQLTQLAADRFEPPYLAAVVYKQAGRSREALRKLETAMTIRPDYLPALVMQAELFTEDGRAAEARRAYESILQQNASLAPAHYGLGRALTALDDVTAAAEAYRKAAQILPSYGAAHYAAAQAFRKLGRTREAEFHQHMFEKAPKVIDVIPDSILAHVHSRNAGGQYHIQRSLALETAGRLEEAAEANRRALELDPRLTQAHVNLISIYGRLRRVDDAARHYREAVANDSKSAEAHYNYGVMLTAAGQYVQAKQAFRRAIDANPKHADAHNNYAFLIESEGRLDEAQRHYEAAISIAPTHPLANYHMGRLLIGRKQPRKAIPCFERILSPENAVATGALYGLATAHARLGNRRKALAYAQRAHQLAVRYNQLDLIARLERDVRALQSAGR